MMVMMMYILLRSLSSSIQGPEAPSQCLRRVTVIIDDASEGQFLCGAIRSLKWAHLIAARPTSDKALTFLCEAGDVDIISLDLGGRLAFSLLPKQVISTWRGMIISMTNA